MNKIHTDYRNRNREKCKTINFNGIKDIDICIKPLLQELWKNNIETLESCCGHNIHEPKIKIAYRDDYEKAKEIITNFGIYDFTIQYNQDISVRVVRDDKKGSLSYREQISFINRRINKKIT